MYVRYMKVVLTASWILISASPLVAQDRSGLLTQAEKRSYHACLYASYIHSYCHFNAWGSSEAAYDECVISNRAGRIAIGFSYWDVGVEDACRNVARQHR